MGREKKERSVQVSMHKQALILGFIWLVHDESEERLTLSGEFFFLLFLFYLRFQASFFKSRNLVWCFFFFFHLPGSWIFFFFTPRCLVTSISVWFFFLSFFSFWFGRGGLQYLLFFIFPSFFFPSILFFWHWHGGGVGRVWVSEDQQHGDENLVHSGMNNSGMNRAY